MYARIRENEENVEEKEEQRQVIMKGNAAGLFACSSVDMRKFRVKRFCCFINSLSFVLLCEREETPFLTSASPCFSTSRQWRNLS